MDQQLIMSVCNWLCLLHAMSKSTWETSARVWVRVVLRFQRLYLIHVLFIGIRGLSYCHCPDKAQLHIYMQASRDVCLLDLLDGGGQPNHYSANMTTTQATVHHHLSKKSAEILNLMCYLHYFSQQITATLIIPGTSLPRHVYTCVVLALTGVPVLSLV